ncbi:hypothetical protein EVAR_11496_1 [Eumeta japonica]|uniref:Uncharacterized protein n=1 Tax=Eumeta variegata TaxID=151549 RepID=A0A4C1TZD3_EUMVA|nr:hypothetical protein EVAR_11496_1 [Eumeta japonica]
MSCVEKRNRATDPNIIIYRYGTVAFTRVIRRHLKPQTLSQSRDPVTQFARRPHGRAGRVNRGKSKCDNVQVTSLVEPVTAGEEGFPGGDHELEQRGLTCRSVDRRPDQSLGPHVGLASQKCSRGWLRHERRDVSDSTDISRVIDGVDGVCTYMKRYHEQINNGSRWYSVGGGGIAAHVRLFNTC